MTYQLVPDILGAVVLAATFVLCLRSFRREDHRHGQSLCDAGVSKQSLAELLNLMDESVGRTVRVRHSPVMEVAEAGAIRMAGVEDRPGAGVFTRQSSVSPLNVTDGIEVTVRVNTQRTSAEVRPVGSTEIINAVWEPLTPEARHAGRLEGSEVTCCSSRESEPSASLIRS